MRKLFALALFLGLAAPALAVVPSTVSRNDFVGNGTASTFTFTFPVAFTSDGYDTF